MDANHARVVRNTLKEAREVVQGIKPDCLPYVRKGSLITARQVRGDKVLLTVVPKLKKDRGFGEPFTVTVDKDDEIYWVGGDYGD